MAEPFLCFGQPCFSPIASLKMCSGLSQTPSASSAAPGRQPERLQLFRQTKKRGIEAITLPPVTLPFALSPVPASSPALGTASRRHGEASWGLRKVTLAAGRTAPGSAGERTVQEQLR